MDQRAFWAGEFGIEYIGRNKSEDLFASNLSLFSEIFSSTGIAPQSFIEFGANIGMNIKALKSLFPKGTFTGVEINSEACKHLTQVCDLTYESSIESFKPDVLHDLVLSKGVLIHIDPENLSIVYEKLVRSTRKWLLIAEYYNPTPVGIEYRGHSDKLFKRDFAGEILDKYPEIKLKSYGFRYHRGVFPQDDITWFLLEREVA